MKRRQDRSTTDAPTVRPYSRYSSRFDATDAPTVRPYSRYSSRFDATDARPSVPTAVTRPVLHDNGSPSDRSDSSDTSDSSDFSDLLPSNL